MPCNSLLRSLEFCFASPWKQRSCAPGKARISADESPPNSERQDQAEEAGPDSQEALLLLAGLLSGTQAGKIDVGEMVSYVRKILSNFLSV